MSFKIALYIDIDAGGGVACLLDGLSSSPANNLPVFCQGDAIPLQLYFREKASSTLNDSTSVTLPADSVLHIAAKKVDSLDSASYLFNASSFTAQTDALGTFYGSSLLLNTTEIQSLFAVLTSNEASILVDIEVQNADNTERITFQFSATLKQEVFNTVDIPATPDTPNYRISNGNLYFYDPISELWYPLTLQNQGGIPMFAPGPGVTL